MQRNAALRSASDVLKADSRARGKVVKIEWMKERVVTVDKVYAFHQNSNDLTSLLRGFR